MTWPWRRAAEAAKREREQAEERLAEVRAQRTKAEDHARQLHWWMAVNHISPKIQHLIHQGRQ